MVQQNNSSSKVYNLIHNSNYSNSFKIILVRYIYYLSYFIGILFDVFSNWHAFMRIWSGLDVIIKLLVTTLPICRIYNMSIAVFISFTRYTRICAANGKKLLVCCCNYDKQIDLNMEIYSIIDPIAHATGNCKKLKYLEYSYSIGVKI